MNLQDLRKYRFYNMAIFDLVATFFIAFIVHYILWSNPLEMKDKSKRTSLQYIVSLLLIFLMFISLGVIFHRIFRIQSAFSGYIGFNDIVVNRGF